MKILALVLLTTLTACGASPDSKTGMTLNSTSPEVVITCGHAFLIGTPTPKLLDSTIIDLPNGPYTLNPSCAITSTDGAISSDYTIERPKCVGWCSRPLQVVKCTNGTLQLMNHKEGSNYVNYEVSGDELIKTTDNCLAK